MSEQCNTQDHPNPIPIIQQAVRRSSSNYTMSLASLTTYNHGTPQGVGVKHGSYARYLAKKKGGALLGKAGDGKARKYPAIAGCEC